MQGQIKSRGAAAAAAGWRWFIVWVALVPLCLSLRPPLPVDETRYLSVVWDMWRRPDWLVPHLNGALYSDKPPLLFWTILIGWLATGVNQWWPRLLSPLYSVVAVLLLARVARRLSPERPELAGFSVLFLSGVLWVSYSTVLLFDLLLAVCVLLALSGVVAAWRGNPRSGWVGYGLGIGLGILAKGPVVLVYVLPAALLAPWWGGTPRASRPAWYLGVAAGLVLGGAIGLVWALAAGAQGGEEYRSAILWEQTAGRVVNAFAHRRPWWWYLPLLPVVLFPWFFWPPLWRSLANMRGRPADPTTRLALAWIGPGFLLLSVISGKQVHYLIPLLPGFALLAATAFNEAEPHNRRWEVLLPAAVLVVGGAVLLFCSFRREPWWAAELSPAWPLLLVIGALALLLASGELNQLRVLSLASPVLLLWAHLAGRQTAQRRYDLTPVATYLHAEEESGRPIGYVGRYQGQFNFLGRLHHPIGHVSPARVSEWARQHPTGLIVEEQRRSQLRGAGVRAWPHGDRFLVVTEPNSPTSQQPSR